MCFLVASLVSALTPFSQNSNRCRSSSGLGQAQLWQSKPSFLFTLSQSPIARMKPVSRAVNFTLWNNASIPPAVRSGLRRQGFLSSCGCAPGVGRSCSTWLFFSLKGERKRMQLRGHDSGRHRRIVVHEFLGRRFIFCVKNYNAKSFVARFGSSPGENHLTRFGRGF